MLASREHRVPKTTTKQCTNCLSYPIRDRRCFRGRTDQTMCAISDKNEFEFDVCAGDSGGEIVSL